MNSQTLPQQKHHFLVLDGLRGVAAFMVVVFHFMEIIETDFTKNILAHGYLAVDFFFCLSGFVIAYAYDDRMQNKTVKWFCKQRLLRLQPLVILGAILGLLAFIFDPFGNYIANYSIVQIIMLFAATVFVIPYPVMEDRYFNLFGLNAPAWSLFWEYIASAAYAIILVKLSRKWTAALTLIAAITLFSVGYIYNSTSGGWDGSTFWHGGARLFYSFLAGMCIFRYRLIIHNKLGFLPISLLLCLAFFMPWHPNCNWLTEPLVITLYFPLILTMGAGSTLTEKHKKACVFLGQLSYPLYITHYFALWGFGSYYATKQPNMQTLLIVVPCLIVVQIVVAYLAMKFYDSPLRKRLSK